MWVLEHDATCADAETLTLSGEEIEVVRDAIVGYVGDLLLHHRDGDEHWQRRWDAAIALGNRLGLLL